MMLKLSDGTIVSEGHSKDAVRRIIDVVMETPGALEELNAVLGRLAGVALVLFYRDEKVTFPEARIEFVNRVMGRAVVAGATTPGKALAVPVDVRPVGASLPEGDPGWGVMGRDGTIPIPKHYVVVERIPSQDRDGDPMTVTVFGPPHAASGPHYPVTDEQLGLVVMLEAE